MPKSSSHMLCTSTTGPGGVAPRLLEPGGNLFWGPPCLPLFSREFPSLISSQVMRLMVVWGPYFENQYIRKRSSLRYDHTCLCRGTSVYQDEITHTQHQANVPPRTPPLLTMGFCCSTVRSRSPCSQNSAATSRATCKSHIHTPPALPRSSPSPDLSNFAPTLPGFPAW